jgi:flagellar protein FlaJ
MKTKKEKKPKKKKENLFGLKPKYQALLFSIPVAVILALAGFVLGSSKLYGVFIGFAVIIAFTPYSLVVYLEKKKVIDMENNFPSFLRDMAESKKTGMTLPQAVYKAAKVDYGKLSKEVAKMSNQISWGVPFHEVLERFSKRSNSRFIQRAVAIIIEAQVTGGAIVETLDAVANDARLIKETEKERKSKLNQQAMIMYAIFFLFVAIVVALQRLLIPLVRAEGFSLAAETPEAILGYYQNLFFSMIVIQAIFSGILAGQIAEGSAVIGLKHSAIFLFSGVTLSWIFLF